MHFRTRRTHPRAGYRRALAGLQPLEDRVAFTALLAGLGEAFATTGSGPSEPAAIVSPPEDVGDITILATSVVGRRLFYNDSGAASPSRFDGRNPAINALDDRAIATDKSAYLPGTDQATFANISSYSKGINGIMVDLAGSHGAISAADFIFRVGNSNTPDGWLAAPAPSAVSVRAGAGSGGSDRVEIVWTNGAIKNQWLEVIVKANANTGLAQKAGYPSGQGDVFFFGSAVGDTGFGNTVNFATVNVTDELQARNNAQGVLVNVPITSIHDFDRDGTVDATDQVIARINTASVIEATRYLSISAPQALSGVINLATLGAKGDGVTDNQSIIASALAQARTQGKRVYLPAGNYVHSGVLVCDGVEFFGDGAASVLIASNPLKAAIYLRGTNPNLHDLSVTALRGDTARQSNPDSHLVVADRCNGFRIDHVNVSQGAAAGIFNFGSRGTADAPGLITNNTVEATLADGIHNTFGAAFVTVSGNRVRGNGDDMIAVVSYQNEQPCHDITITGNDVAGNYWGRGITVVGGDSITITNNTIANTEAAGILIYSEFANNGTLGVNNVLVQGNTIGGACTGGCGTGQPGILLGGRPGYLVSGVRVIGNTVTNSTRQAIRVDNQYVSSSSITGNIISRYSGIAILVPAGAGVTVSGNIIQ